jgi:hypothetical protein
MHFLVSLNFLVINTNLKHVFFFLDKYILELPLIFFYFLIIKLSEQVYFNYNFPKFKVMIMKNAIRIRKKKYSFSPFLTPMNITSHTF